MEEQTQQSNHHTHLPLLDLKYKPYFIECAPETPNILHLSLANHTVSAIDIEKMKVLHQTDQIHQNRIGAIRCKDNLLLTAGYDNQVRLFDARTYEHICAFQRVPAKFNTIDKSNHILAAAYNDHITFWDLKKRKQRTEFKDSFNSEITCLRFHETVSTRFGCCDLSGMISMFDLTQPNEEDAFEWCFKILESPQKIVLSQNNTLLVQTTDHILLKVNDGELLGRIAPNNIENPKHIVSSSIFNQNMYQYSTFSHSERVIEGWVGSLQNQVENCFGYINMVNDVQLIHVWGEEKKKAVWVDERGHVFTQIFGPSKILQQGEKLQPQMNDRKIDSNKFRKQKKQEDLTIPQMNKNGYLLNKPSSFSKKRPSLKKPGPC